MNGFLGVCLYWYTSKLRVVVPWEGVGPLWWAGTHLGAQVVSGRGQATLGWDWQSGSWKAQPSCLLPVSWWPCWGLCLPGRDLGSDRHLSLFRSCVAPTFNLWHGWLLQAVAMRDPQT